MFNKYEIRKINDKECLFLYINEDYEFSKEFLQVKEGKKKKRNIYNAITDFIKEHKIKFKGKMVYLILDGLLVGTVILSDIMNPIAIEQSNFKYAYSNNYWEHVKVEKAKTEQPKEEVTPKVTVPKKVITPKTVTPKKDTAPKAVTPKENITVEQKPIVKTPQEKAITITLYRYNGTVQQIALEDYVIGVVAAEMPASFHPEALKAQSLAARTYALKRVAENKVIADTSANQNYKDINQLKTMWDSSFNTYYNKIKSAVESTKGQYIAYNNYYIDAVYHSTSNGQTEDPIYVWGGSFPYLKSVDSHWDLNAPTYERTQNISFGEVSKILGIDFNQDTEVKVVSKTTGERINEIAIDHEIYSGIDIRDLFGLRSADFDINIQDGNIVFTTTGYGHGVGMSQFGANGMAKEGYSYRQIINHYYPNTSILSKS